MGSRTLPFECEHGVTVDWGDFGPCEDCSEHELGECPNFTTCEQCEAQRPDFEGVVRLFLAGWRPGTDGLWHRGSERAPLTSQHDAALRASSGEENTR